MGYYRRGNVPTNTNRYSTRRPIYRTTPAAIEAEMDLVAKQRIVLELEKELERIQLELRAWSMDWLDERVTLDDILDETMRGSICTAISVFSR